MTTKKRLAIGKKLRFEVFKRDCFKCMYCGAEAPKALLHIDHIKPVSQGGGNDILNLITACESCNSGKSDRLLSDDSTLAKQRDQLNELSARREQMDLMLSWRSALQEINSDQIKAVQEQFSKSFPGWGLKSEAAVKKVNSYLKKYGLLAVLDAVETSADRYLKTDAEGVLDMDSVQLAWAKIGGILRIQDKTPEQQRLYYVKGILVNRLSYVPSSAMSILEDALDAGIEAEEMVEEAKTAKSWTSFLRWLEG